MGIKTLASKSKANASRIISLEKREHISEIDDNLTDVVFIIELNILNRD